MNLKKLNYFITLVDAGSFSRAAELLYITQPALSWSIKDLEESLSTQLILRTPQGIELTKTGKILYVGAKQLLDNATNLKRAVSLAQSQSKRSVKLGLTILSSITYMDRFQKFTKQYSEYKLSYTQRGSKEIQNLVANGELDLGLVSEPIYVPELEKSKIQLKGLYYDVAVVLPCDHPLGSKDYLTLDMVSDQEIAMMTQSFAMGNEIEKRMNELGYDANIVFNNENWEVIVEHVSSYKSITFLPMGIKDLLTRDDLVWVPLKDDKVGRFNLFLVTNLDLVNKEDKLLFERFKKIFE